MNEKDAKENIKFHGVCDATLYEQGYLEAIEKAKVLRRALGNIVMWDGEECVCEDADCVFFYAKQAIEKWEEEK